MATISASFMDEQQIKTTTTAAAGKKGILWPENSS